MESSKLTTEMIFRLGNYDTCRVLYILEMEVAWTSQTSHYGISFTVTGVRGCYGGAVSVKSLDPGNWRTTPTTKCRGQMSRFLNVRFGEGCR